MKAAVRRIYGDSDIITVEEVKQPIPKKNEVLVKVRATTVNRTDCAILTGKPWVMRLFIGLSKPKSPFLGTDFAGEVAAVGKEVRLFKVGDKVWGFHDEGINSQAEYMVCAENGNISFMPSSISFESAVASLEGVHYAYNFRKKVIIDREDKVLINGATGAIGSALLQILKAEGIYVTAVCNTPNIKLIKSLGADKIHDYLKEDFTKTTEQYDFVCDAVGKSTFSKCKPILQPKGIYISSELGPNGQNIPLSIFTPMLGKKKVIFPFPKNVKQSMEFIKDLIEEGKFRAVIDRTYSLSDIADAYSYTASGQKTGNVVISIPNMV